MADGKAFTLEIVTPARIVFAGSVTTVVAPAAEGYLGVLAHHAPMLVTLTPGVITGRTTEGTLARFQNQGGGVLEVLRNRVTVLADRVAA